MRDVQFKIEYFPWKPGNDFDQKGLDNLLEAEYQNGWKAVGAVTSVESMSIYIVLEKINAQKES